MEKLNLQQVLEKMGVSKATLYRLIKAGDFPPPAKCLSQSWWKADDIDNYWRSIFRQRDQLFKTNKCEKPPL